MGHATVNNVHRLDSALGRVERAADLGHHAAGDGAVGKQGVDLARAEFGEQFASLVEHAADVGQHQEFFGVQHGGQFGGDYVGVDVVALVVFAKADGADNGNKGVVLQGLDHAGVNADDVADLAHVKFDAGVGAVEHFELLRPDHGAIAPGQAHGLATCLVDQAHDVLLHFAAQHPLDYLHGFGVGHAHALDELAGFAQALERVLNLRAAAVHHHRVDAHQLEQHHVLGKSGLEGGVGHGVTAVLDDHGFAMELADIGQGLGQDFGLVVRRKGSGGWVLWHGQDVLADDSKVCRLWPTEVLRLLAECLSSVGSLARA